MACYYPALFAFSLPAAGGREGGSSGHICHVNRDQFRSESQFSQGPFSARLVPAPRRPVDVGLVLQGIPTVLRLENELFLMPFERSYFEITVESLRQFSS